MVNRREEFLDIALEYPKGLCVILAHPICVSSKNVHRAVRSFPETTRVRIIDELSVKKWIQDSIDSMVHESIAHTRLMNIAWLWVAYFEMMVATMTISARNEILVKRRDIFYEIVFKRLHVFLFLLAFQKLLPRVKQIVGRNDIVVRMRHSDSVHLPERTPPPTISQEKFVPVVLKLKEAYLAWQEALQHVAKARRQTIAARIDGALLDTLEHAFRAEYLSGERKIAALDISIVRLDIAKFFLLVGWESDAITNSQHLRIAGLLVDAGKMLVGWRVYLEKKTPTSSGRK